MRAIEPCSNTIFLRYLTDDVPDQARAAEALFRRAAAGEVQLVTNSLVLAEIVWVLESYYCLTKPAVQERALAVAYMEGLDLPGRETVTEALLAYAETGVDYADAYNAAWQKLAPDAPSRGRRGWPPGPAGQDSR